jgi:hypothetical protein
MSVFPLFPASEIPRMAAALLSAAKAVAIPTAEVDLAENRTFA